MWTLEVANVLLLAERRRRISRPDADRLLGLLAALPITVTEPEGLRRLDAFMTLARTHRLTACDAAYLMLASTERAPLATRGRALRTAADAAGVRRFSP